MKSITTKKTSFLPQGILGLLLFSLAGHGQVQNNGNLYVGSGANFYVPGNYAFGTGTTATDKSATYGSLQLGSAGSYSGASSSKFADGYVSTYGSASFLFPIGASSVYAPVRVTSGVAAQTAAAYFNASATNTSSLATGLAAVSTAEYWDIKGTGTAATVRLTWRSASNLTTLAANNLSALTIVGYNASTAKWDVITSAIDVTSEFGSSSTYTTGSITATGVNLNNYRYFTFGRKVENCADLIVSSGVTKTWNGSAWSPSAPTLADPVVISGAYAAGSFACNSITLNANVTLANGQSLEIVNGVSGGSGKIIMASEATIVQRNAASAGPSIELTKTTLPKKRYDHIYWGSPIAENAFSQIANAKATAGGAPVGAFDELYKYVSGTGTTGWQPLTAVELGKGFTTRVKGQTPFVDAVTTSTINMPFVGTANNGAVNVAIANNPSTPNGGTSFQLLANPYPSALDGQKFLTENAGSLSGTLYFWTAKTSYAGSGAYGGADYAIWNLAGAVGTSPTGLVPTGKIASGQSFMVRSLVASGTAKFNNCMRVASGNNVFFRMSEPDTHERDRFKLSMSNADGIFSQIQIGYFPEAGDGFDDLLDAARNSVSSSQLYSFIGDQKMAINTKGSFVLTDEVPLGILKGTDDSGVFTITLSDAEGTFANDTKVYLHDKQFNIYTDLTVSDYTFTTAATDNNRFEVVYEAEALANPDFGTQNAFAFIKAAQFHAQASSSIEKVELYDITGRLVQQYKGGNSQSLTGAFHHSEGIYIAKITLASGQVVDAKLINMK